MYDGGESLEICRFQEKINDVANLGKWSNDEKVTILKLKLAGIAEEFFYPTQPTVKQQSTTISQEFLLKDSRRPSYYQRVYSYFHHAFRVLLRAYKNSQHALTNWEHRYSSQENSAQNTAVRNANDQLLQSRFISGLRNDIRRFVLARDSLNLDELISATLIEEQNMKLNQIANDERSGLSPSQTENSVLSALTDRLEEINLRVGRLQEASSVTARKTGGNFFNRSENVFKCFYCGIQGHRQAECRKKKRDIRTSNY
ncbi:hypothetical protein TNCV_1653861 [Trichonephila clavipes]|nr:hypothetical protein TNCV_1653861 [Trichonephila clavipes]